MTAPAESASWAPVSAALEQFIVRTPVAALADPASGCTLWLKLEYCQPGGSTKDRLAVFVLDRALSEGRVAPGGMVAEASSGSTSISFAMACARLGISFLAFMPTGVSPERIQIIRRYGAGVQLTPAAAGMLGAIEACERFGAEQPGVFLPRQFANPLNAEAHRRTTAVELVEQVGHPIDGFVAGVGTGGTLAGVGVALRHLGRPVRLVRAVPGPGLTPEGGPEVCSSVPGIVEGMSRILDLDALGVSDITIAADDVIAGARDLCRLGFSGGLSSGLNVAAARVLAGQLGPGHHIATVLCDRMERYLTTELFSDLRPPDSDR